MKYYNEKGELDRFMTYINNHNWCFYVGFLVVLIITGLIEGLA